MSASNQNQLHTLSGPDYGYDAAGNMTLDATTGNSCNFDQENRISGVGGFTYTYDVDGDRVEKFNGLTGTIYWYTSLGVVAESDLSGNLMSEYVFFGDGRVARKDLPSGAVSYYFSDHLKTASAIADSAGNINRDEDYYPWGGELRFVNNDSNHYKFTGKERDEETGSDYFGARYYSNRSGRFATADPLMASARASDPQSWNRYTYVRNAPVTFTDPTGLLVQDCGWSGGCIRQGAVDGLQQATTLLGANGQVGCPSGACSGNVWADDPEGGHWQQKQFHAFAGGGSGYYSLQGPGALYYSAEDAAKAAALYYLGTTQSDNRERFGNVYQDANNVFSFNYTSIGSGCGSNAAGTQPSGACQVPANDTVPKGTTKIYDFHTHPFNTYLINFIGGDLSRNIDYSDFVGVVVEDSGENGVIRISPRLPSGINNRLCQVSGPTMTGVGPCD